MKKRYASGGMTQADRDAGLTQADVDAGLRGGRNERISDEDRARAMMNAARNSESLVDQYRDYGKNPEAQAFPIDPKPRAAPRPVAAPRSEPRSEPRSSMTEMPEEGASSAPGTSRRAPGRGSYDQNGPVGDLIDIIRNRMNRPSPYRRSTAEPIGAKKGGSVNKMVKKASSASKRGDGIATKGKTKGRFV